MNYKIIKNEDTLKQFIEWLPVLAENGIYYVSLLGRKKYNASSGLSQDKQQLKRFTSTKERLFEKIKQLECEVGSYSFKGKAVPQDSLALYISVNPRDMKRATKNSLINFANIISENYNTNYNPHQIVLSEIQKSCTRKLYVDFDFDLDFNLNVNSISNSWGLTCDELCEKVINVINTEAVTFLRTRGGMHVLIEVSKIDKLYKENWHKDISKISGLDKVGDLLIPVPGCVQGDFMPYFYKT